MPLLRPSSSRAFLLHPALAARPSLRCARLALLVVLIVAGGWPLIPAQATSPTSLSVLAPDGEAAGEWPLRPRPEVVHGFDPPDAPWGSGHRGIDLAATAGQSVYAVMPGEVRLAKMIAGRPVVVVDHGDTRTTYEPVLSTLKVGTKVAIGDKIGLLTTAQSHCAPAACLHLGWIRNSDDVYLDPLLLFGAKEVRLLPWGAAATGRPSFPAQQTPGWRPATPALPGARNPPRSPSRLPHVCDLPGASRLGLGLPLFEWIQSQARGWACW